MTHCASYFVNGKKVTFKESSDYLYEQLMKIHEQRYLTDPIYKKSHDEWVVKDKKFWEEYNKDKLG